MLQKVESTLKLDLENRRQFIDLNIKKAKDLARASTSAKSM
jgi:hypothetical protein